jgi:hypothetical protein
MSVAQNVVMTHLDADTLANLPRTLSERKLRSSSPSSERSTTASDRNTAASSRSDDGKSPSVDGLEDLYLISFTRCPREFRTGLLEGPVMKDCRDCMQLAGLSTELETGTKIFCKPAVYNAAREAIKRFEEMLRPYHVIVTAEFRPLVMQIVKGFPRALKVKCKDENVIARVGDSDTWVPVAEGIESVESQMNESKEAAPMETQKKEEAPQRKAKGTKGSSSPKAEAAKKGSEEAQPALPGNALSLDSLLPSFPPVSPVDPALAFPAFNPAAALETDPAFVQFVQAMEQQQAIFNQALVLNMQMLQDNYMFAAALDQQLGNKA